jgi:leucyl-tRNA synthetase
LTFSCRYGQTNCFVGITIKYGVYAINDNEAFVCTYRSARNMAFQGVVSSRGELKELLQVEGSQIVGTKIKAPFAANPEVYVLPMENVLATKVHIPLRYDFEHCSQFLHHREPV